MGCAPWYSTVADNTTIHDTDVAVGEDRPSAIEAAEELRGEHVSQM
jgi:hypothetical protein